MSNQYRFDWSSMSWLPPKGGGRRFVYDIETNGLLDELDTIHSLVMYDLDTKELLSFRNDGHPDNWSLLVAAVDLLAKAERLIGHNIINFDERALQKLFPWYPANTRGKVVDTIILTRLIWPNIKESDLGRVKRGQLEGRLIGSHSLEAWGMRVGEWKGDFAKVEADKLIAKGVPKDEAKKLVWAKWTQEMQDYCDQDVRTNLTIYERCKSKGYEHRAVHDEMDMAILCSKIETNGFPLHEPKAGKLYATLAGERANLEQQLKDTFGSWVERVGEIKTPKTSNSQHGYWGETFWVEDRFDGETRIELPAEAFSKKGNVRAKWLKENGVKKKFAGYPYQPVKIVEFNPTSRIHIANRLTELYGWEPSEFTPDGRPKVDEDVMAALPYDCAPLLTRYFLVIKRIGQLAEGKQAWLKLVREGRIHGRYNTVGAVTRRATHSSPNIGQVPGVGADFGTECRELFHAPEGWVQVGIDASGLELRCLAHYMARWDSGEYGEVILNGDIHTHNQNLAGLPERGMAKTLIYAFLYGGGDGKLGQIVGGSVIDGKKLRAKFLEGLPALDKLVKAVKHKAEHFKSLNALDGGRLHVRSGHSALNTLLQSAGALVCKKWGVLFEQRLLDLGYKHGWDGDFVFMAWVHDEYQVACKPELVEIVEEASKWAIKETEKYYGFRIPLDCEAKVGANWAECH